MKTVFFNGQFVPASEARVSVFDRALLYGDALFETLLVHRGKPFFWQRHWDRLEQGAVFMQIKLPLDSDQALRSAGELLKQNEMTDAVLRIHVSRGTGARGYSIRNACSPVVTMTLHEAPKPTDVPMRWRLKTASYRVLKNDPLARIKSSNKLLHVLARTEAEQGGFDEALLLNSEGEVAEATSGNIFWVEKGEVFTPPLEAGILPGVTRSVVLDLCRASGISCTERSADLVTIKRSDAVFLTLSTLGIVEVQQLDEQALESSEVTLNLFRNYHRTLV